MSFDPIELLRRLKAERVEFIVIGGVAAAAHGSPSVTQDVDICYARSDDNIARLVSVLRSISASVRGAPAAVGFLLDAETIKRGDHFTFTTELGDLDVLGHPAGTDGFDDLSETEVLLNIQGLEVPFASVGDLIRMKRAANRPKDRVELEILGALRQELNSEE